MKKASVAVLLSRAGLITATTLSTYVASMGFGHIVFRDGVGFWSVVLWFLFAILFFWVAQGFWTATIGLLHMLRKSPTSIVPVREKPVPWKPAGQLSRTAVLMPIYNEDPARVFAGLEAMIRSIAQTGYERAFDFFVLSDTRDPVIWVHEQAQLAALRDSVGDLGRVFYRRRHQNKARKSGNIEEWCERYGSAYTFMLVLDADSVMDGRTVVEMAQRIAARDDIGILQAPPRPVGRISLFARCQQFASRVYGEVFTTGFGVWTHLDGNYYGHNAIIRVEAFVKHCGLPLLPGKPPMGGEILSHDFVEAALMRKAGYNVQIAYDLSGSYEECPTTLLDYAKRDQRWCQGNMQHVRLVFTRGYHPLSRVHLGMGVMSYLASPLWLAFMLVGLLAVADARWWHWAEVIPRSSPVDPLPPALVAGLLFGIVMLMLLIPKFYAVAMLLTRPQLLRACGGELHAIAGAFIEIAVSMLIAPLMMLYHSQFVVMTLLGRSVNWAKQNRDETMVGWREAWHNHWKHTLIGIVAAAVAYLVSPTLALWASPVFAGLILAVPTAVLLSSARVGLWLRRRGLLLIPEELQVPRVLRLFNKALRRTTRLAKRLESVDALDRVVADPAMLELHRITLTANPEPYTLSEGVDVAGATERAMSEGMGKLPRAEQVAVLSSPESMERLHRYAWTLWPSEKLDAIRKEPLHTLIAQTRWRRSAVEQAQRNHAAIATGT